MLRFFRIGGTKAAFYCIVQNLFDRLLIDNRIALENFVTTICQQRMNSIISKVKEEKKVFVLFIEFDFVVVFLI